MVDLSWTHILIVLVVALVVVGPKDLPRLMRMTGRWVAKARSMADQFRKSFDEMARQSELDELRAELDSLRHERPLADLEHGLAMPVTTSPPNAVPPSDPAGEATHSERSLGADSVVPGPDA